MVIDEANLSPQEQKIHHQATQMLERGVDAPTFSARFFGPQGELAQLGTEREARERILRSELYGWLKARFTELRLRDAASFEQETRTASGA